MQTDLSLVPTDFLMEEAMKRFDYFVCSARKYTNNNGEFIDFRKFYGNTLVCNSLCDLMKIKIMQDELSFQKPIMENKDR